MAKKTGRVGGQYGNRNAVKHGAYMELSSGYLDGRTKEAKILSEVEASLSTALGGDPSPQQTIIIQRAAVKAFKCARLEAVIVAGEASESAEADYLKWARELRKDLKAIGLERKARPVQSLKDWMQNEGATA